jgi:SAM-dependent methyltransferase
MTCGDGVNEEQVEQWEGGEGAHFVAHQAHYDSLYAPINDELVRAAALTAGERVLDVGCGCGASTIAAAPHAAPGPIVGVDLSNVMLARAAERAQELGLTNVRFEHADAQVHDFGAAAFDVVMSRFGVMYFDDPVTAFANLRSALASDGRLVFACFASALRNRWVSVPGVALLAHIGRPPKGPDKGPFSLQRPGLVRDILARAGFSSIRVDAIERDGMLATGVDEAIAFYQANSIFRGSFRAASPDARAAAVDSLRAALRAHEHDGGVWLTVSALIVSASAA